MISTLLQPPFRGFLQVVENSSKILIKLSSHTLFIIATTLLFFGFLNAQKSQRGNGEAKNLIVNGDFENPAVKGGKRPHKSAGWEWHHAVSHWAGSIEIDSSVTRNLNSKYSMKFNSTPFKNWSECNKSVKGKSSNRCRHTELKVGRAHNSSSEEGMDTWYGFSFKVNKFPSDGRRFYIFQFHSTKQKKGEFFSPLIGFRLIQDSLVMSKAVWKYDSATQKRKCCTDLNFSSRAPLTLDTWFDVEFHILWSQNEGLLEGRYKSEHDTLFTDFTLPGGGTKLQRETMLNPYPSYIKTGMYWAWDPKFDGNLKLPKKGWFSDTLSIHIDNVKAAESYEQFIQLP